MPKSYADLLREARAEIREVSPDRGRTPGPARWRAARSTSARRPVGPGPRARRSTCSKSYIEQDIEARRPTATPRSSSTAPAAIRSLFAAQTLQAMGYTDVASMTGGFQEWKGAGPGLETAGRPDRRAEARYSRHLLIPEVGSAGQAKLLESKALLVGAGGLGSPALALPRGRGRRHDRHPRLRRRRPLQPAAPDRPHHRPCRRAEGRLRPHGR